MKILFYFIILIILNTSNCSEHHDFKEIKFGEGGGFTGAITEYQIKPNGDIFIKNSYNKENRKIKTIDDSELKNIEKKFNSLSVESMNFNHPGNLYYFIESGQTKIVWGNSSFPEPKDIKELFFQLNQIIKN